MCKNIENSLKTNSNGEWTSKEDNILQWTNKKVKRSHIKGVNQNQSKENRLMAIRINLEHKAISYKDLLIRHIPSVYP